jgi:hypothetical protein
MSAGQLVHRSHSGLQAWCLCPGCSASHAGHSKRRTKHDRWALAGHDWRIRQELGL